MTLPPFQRLLDAHRDAVWRVCVASVGPDEADDAFQETWIAALRGYGRLRDATNLRGWLLTIAHTKAIDVHRARARRPVAVGVIADEATAAPAEAAADDDLWDAVRALPDGQRAAVTLRYAGDLRPAEIAAALDISEEAARRRVADGLATLRKDVHR
jgi:RNA polymerase sigma factor (sigma-70 family)